VEGEAIKETSPVGTPVPLLEVTVIVKGIGEPCVISEAPKDNAVVVGLNVTVPQFSYRLPTLTDPSPVVRSYPGPA